MRLLYAATDQRLDTYHGGTVHVLSVAGEMAKLGHHVTLVTQEPADGSVKMPDGVEHRTIPRSHRFLLWRTGRLLGRIIEECGPDAVMERYYNFAGNAVLQAAERGIPTVLEVNSPMVEYSGSPKAWVDLLLLSALKRRRERTGEAASLIIAPMKQIVPEKLQEKVREIEWGADTDLFDPALLPDREILRMEKGFAQDEVLLIHFGSLRSWHGLEVLQQAFQLVRSLTKARVRLVVIGPAERKDQEDIHYTGVLPHEELASWLKMCDIAVLPFSPEKHGYLKLGFYWSPLKIFEAMAMEMPIITLDHPRLRAILGTDSPGFFYNGTAAGLADRILEMLDDLPVFQATGKAFRDRLLRRYSWQAHAARLNHWLNELTEGGGTPQRKP